jgi:hypothetical protein
MSLTTPLLLHEEILLLALRNQAGTVITGYVEHALAGALLSELLLEGRISIGDGKKQLVEVRDTSSTGEEILDECLKMIQARSRRASLQTWVSRLAGVKELRHKVARRLCKQGILRADTDKVMLLFTRKIYPELNPEPEQRIVERLRAAVFTDDDQLDPRTVVLISLANGADLLGPNLGRKEVKRRKKRIEQIINGEMMGKATREVIEACQTAVMVAAIMPAIIASTSN